MFNGIVIVNKEQDFTSHDVVAKMRGIFGQKKIGHTGTLDPAATGVLPVCLGSGTRLCDMLTDRNKEYIAELLLGVETDTQDTTGQIIRKLPVMVTKEEVRKACEAFVGDYMQIPPMYSALKVNGKKLYELAREGREIERKARPVRIEELQVLEMNLPIVKMRVLCTKGTYIRTLCADIGGFLGCGGTMQSLIRSGVGEYRLEQAYTLSELQTLKEENRLQEALIPVDNVFRNCPSLHVKADWVRLLENGNPLSPEYTLEEKIYSDGEWVRLYHTEGRFMGVYSYDASKRKYHPVKMFIEKE